MNLGRCIYDNITVISCSNRDSNVSPMVGIVPVRTHYDVTAVYITYLATVPLLYS